MTKWDYIILLILLGLFIDMLLYSPNYIEEVSYDYGVVIDKQYTEVYTTQVMLDYMVVPTTIPEEYCVIMAYYDIYDYDYTKQAYDKYNIGDKVKYKIISYYTNDSEKKYVYSYCTVAE